MTLRTVRIWLWVAVVVVGLTAGAGALYLRQSPPQDAGTFGVAEFDVVDQNGNPVDESIMVGAPTAMFFGFTNCPEVCPTTMAEMASWFEALGPDAKDLRALFVTVDPERDTPAILGDYISWFGDRVTGITGSPEEIAKVAKAWGVYVEKVPLEGGGYTMDHTTSVFLLDSAGEFQGTIAYREETAVALGKLRNLLAKS